MFKRQAMPCKANALLGTVPRSRNPGSQKYVDKVMIPLVSPPSGPSYSHLKNSSDGCHVYICIYYILSSIYVRPCVQVSLTSARVIYIYPYVQVYRTLHILVWEKPSQQQPQSASRAPDRCCNRILPHGRRRVVPFYSCTLNMTPQTTFFRRSDSEFCGLVWL